MKDAVSPSKGDLAIRQRIVAGARKHFFALGFRSVTMSDLASELGMSKKTLYAHFASKTELLDATLQDKFAHVERDLERICRTPAGEFANELRQLLEVLQFHTAEIQSAFVRDVKRETPEFFEKIKERRSQMIQRYFGKVLQSGRKAGMIRSDISVRMMVEMLVGATESLVTPERMTALGLTPKEGFLTVISIFLEGVMTRKTTS
jgi:AcrR family transcriptional regulator